LAQLIFSASYAVRHSNIDLDHADRSCYEIVASLLDELNWNDIAAGLPMTEELHTALPVVMEDRSLHLNFADLPPRPQAECSGTPRNRSTSPAVGTLHELFLLELQASTRLTRAREGGRFGCETATQTSHVS
jgi:hypothetical protein